VDPRATGPRPPVVRAGLLVHVTGSSEDLLTARAIAGYREYRRRFTVITRRAGERFESRDWDEAQEDSRERILVYDVVLHETLRDIRQTLPDTATWPDSARRARSAFAEWARGEPDSEIAETFFNSIVRRMFGTIGVDPDLEFVGGAVDHPSVERATPWDCVPLEQGLAAALTTVLEALPFQSPWHDRDARAHRAADVFHQAHGPAADWRNGELQVLRPLFFRNKAAYLVGRVVRGSDVAPLVVALTHPRRGIQIDALLPSADEASVVFGFSRSYLHGDVGAPRPTVDFLRSIMPLKRVDELYTAIGFNRHGKTELYRTLLEHLAEPGTRFERTPGQPGLVMSVFTLPALNVVFKVIRDRFGHPKKTTRERVIRNYRLIFVRDRVGRLADAQQFEHLELPADRFSDEVLDELLTSASRTVSRRGDTVTIEHLYTERRVRPLDLYLQEVDEEEALRATLDFGQAIKDLAAAEIFPGDMLIKNFGVTRHGRVIFYDYDEVAPLSDCTFRRRPPDPYPEAELSEDPQYYVGTDDVFPEEWRPFLGPPGRLRHELHRVHPELCDPAWWKDIQARQRRGEVMDFYPYEAGRRLDDD
jgi:isocitrate dehydrogenase kinase/phosphatase